MATEKRLIDADAEIATIKENVCRNCNSYNGVRCRACWVDTTIGFIDEAPTVDAVEVVRCKDCKYLYYHNIDEQYYCGMGCGLADCVNPDDFCPYGERNK